MDAQLFEDIDAYNYQDDAEFQLGLTNILQHAQTREQSNELDMKARCFYYSRKMGRPVDFNAYHDWKNSKAEQAEDAAASSASEPSAAATSTNPPSIEDQVASTSIVESTSAGAQTEAPSFTYQQIVDMIQTGKPVPGIKDIPDTVLEGQATESTSAKRRKPWEKEEAVTANQEIAV